jgi:8-oxo-dGTP pyrophosphatase MutT (NUDIX family)
MEQSTTLTQCSQANASLTNKYISPLIKHKDDFKVSQNISYYSERNFYNKEQKSKKKISKSSYIISLINKKYFIEYGATLLTYSNKDAFKKSYNIYHILKTYDGSPSHETCALLGIPIEFWNELLLNDSLLLNFIKSSPELSHIQDISKLSTHYINNPLFYFRYAFKDIKNYCSDDLILFNIEPRGNGRLEKSYPVPLITIPGGSMEFQDNHSFEKCAMREFKEETNIDLENIHIRLYDEKITKKKLKHYVSSSFQENKYGKQTHSEHIHISMFYLVKIISSINSNSST